MTPTNRAPITVIPDGGRAVFSDSEPDELDLSLSAFDDGDITLREWGDEVEDE